MDSSKEIYVREKRPTDKDKFIKIIKEPKRFEEFEYKFEWLDGDFHKECTASGGDIIFSWIPSDLTLTFKIDEAYTEALRELRELYTKREATKSGYNKMFEKYPNIRSIIPENIMGESSWGFYKGEIRKTYIISRDSFMNDPFSKIKETENIIVGMMEEFKDFCINTNILKEYDICKSPWVIGLFAVATPFILIEKAAPGLMSKAVKIGAKVAVKSVCQSIDFDISDDDSINCDTDSPNVIDSDDTGINCETTTELASNESDVQTENIEFHISDSVHFGANTYDKNTIELFSVISKYDIDIPSNINRSYAGGLTSLDKSRLCDAIEDAFNKNKIDSDVCYKLKRMVYRT